MTKTQPSEMPNGESRVPRLKPHQGPILSETRWAGKLALPRAHVAVVVVYQRGDHLVVWPHERQRVHLHRRPATMYEVDLGLHRTVITADLPSKNHDGLFHASISVQWRVLDPSAVVRHRVLDIEETLSASLQRRARGLARKFSISEVLAAEDELNHQLGGVEIDVTEPARIQQAMREAAERDCLGAEFGLWTRAIVHLTLDQAAIEHNAKMVKLNWAMEEEEAEHKLRKLKSRNQQEITKERMVLYREIVAAGDVERFALRLANNPSDMETITELIREDQLTSRRDTIEFISHMVDSGVIERWEVSDQVRHALEWLRDATSRVVTDKEHMGSEVGQSWRQQRRGRGQPPIEESATCEPPPDVIVVKAEPVPSETLPASAEPEALPSPDQ